MMAVFIVDGVTNGQRVSALRIVINTDTVCGHPTIARLRRYGDHARSVHRFPRRRFARPCAVVKFHHELGLAVIQRHSYILRALAPNSRTNLNRASDRLGRAG